MLHPFIPFVTEEIYQNIKLKNHKSIMLSSYPTYDKKEVFDEKNVQNIFEDIVSLRNFKAENGITNNDEVVIKKVYDEKLYTNLLRLKNIVKSVNNPIKYESNYAILLFNHENVINKELINKEIYELEQSIKKRENLLNNQNFVSKAPKNIVDEEKNKLTEEKEKLLKLKAE